MVDEHGGRTSDEVVGEGETGCVAELPRVLVLGDPQASVVRRVDVVIRIVDGLEREEFRRELVRNEHEGRVLVEDMRIARAELRFQVQEVRVVADEPRRSCWIDDRHAEPVLAVANMEIGEAS